MSASLFSPWGSRPIPARIGTRRHTIVVASLYGRTTKLSFSCTRDNLAQDPRRNLAEAFEAFRSAISFRRSLFAHGENHEARNVADVRIPI